MALPAAARHPARAAPSYPRGLASVCRGTIDARADQRLPPHLPWLAPLPPPCLYLVLHADVSLSPWPCAMTQRVVGSPPPFPLVAWTPCRARHVPVGGSGLRGCPRFPVDRLLSGRSAAAVACRARVSGSHCTGHGCGAGDGSSSWRAAAAPACHPCVTPTLRPPFPLPCREPTPRDVLSMVHLSMAAVALALAAPPRGADGRVSSLRPACVIALRRVQ